MSDVNKDMIGTRTSAGREFPKVTIAGYSYRLPVTTIRLSATHFCVSDNRLDIGGINNRVEALRKMVTPKAVSTKVNNESS